MAGGLIRDFGDPAADRGGLPVHQRKPGMVRVVKHNRMFVPVDKDGKRWMTLGSSNLPSTAGSHDFRTALTFNEMGNATSPWHKERGNYAKYK